MRISRSPWAVTLVSSAVTRTECVIAGSPEAGRGNLPTEAIAHPVRSLHPFALYSTPRAGVPRGQTAKGGPRAPARRRETACTAPRYAQRSAAQVPLGMLREG